MAKQSQTELAVLAALSLGPMTGYALRDAITTELGAFWSESFGQIYPALARLRESGAVATAPGTRGSSSVHSLTSAGRERLVALLREPAEPQAPRNGLLLRLFFGEVLGPETCRTLVAEARARAERQLEILAVARADAGSTPEAPQLPYWLMTVSAGEHAARAQIAWADECETVLARLG